jgi:hypothetical protein
LPSATARRCQQIFPRAEQIFPREIYSLFAATIDPAGRAGTKDTAKQGECAQRMMHEQCCEDCSRKQRIKSIFTLPLQCNGQSVVWSRVADSVA